MIMERGERTLLFIKWLDDNGSFIDFDSQKMAGELCVGYCLKRLDRY